MVEPQKNVQKLKAYPYPGLFFDKLKKYNLKVKNVLKLNYNEPTFPPSPKVVETLKKLVTNGKLNWYPEGKNPQLIESIAKYSKVKPEQVIVSNGSDEILLIIAMTYLSKGDEVIIPVPNYEMFSVDATIMGAKIVEVSCDDELKFDYKNIIKKINSKTKAIYLSNPNTPIGGIFTPEQILKIAKAAPKAVIIIDEAYFEYSDITVANLVQDIKNLVVVRTFSKAFSIAGFRLGYCISYKKNIEQIAKVKELLPESVNKFAQVAGIKSLQDLDYVKKKIASVKLGREFLINQIKRIGLKVYDSFSNFILIDFGSTKTALKVKDELEKVGIFVRDRTYKSKLQGCLRFAVPTFSEAKILLNRLKQVLSNLFDYDTLLFDMDGILVDVSKSYRVAIKQTAEFFLNNKEISFEQIQEYKERGGLNNDWDCTQAILKDNGINKTRKEIQQKFDYIYVGGVIDKETLIVDKELLKNLSKKYNLAIITGRPRRDADYTIKKFGLDQYFKTVLTLDEFGDKSLGINFCINKFGSKKTVYIGDTVDDMKAANDSGIDSIGIIPPSSSKRIRKVLLNEGANIVLKNIGQISEVLK